jgi:hypothetical protein
MKMSFGTYTKCAIAIMILLCGGLFLLRKTPAAVEGADLSQKVKMVSLKINSEASGRLQENADGAPEAAQEPDQTIAVSAPQNQNGEDYIDKLLAAVERVSTASPEHILYQARGLMTELNRQFVNVIIHPVFANQIDRV